MTERPILMSAPSVRAILSGAKTQTRRVMKPQPVADVHWYGGAYWERRAASITQPIPEQHSIRHCLRYCPHGEPNHHLWVREAWRTDVKYDAMPPRDIPPGPYFCEASREWWDGGPHDGTPGKLRHGIFMPRWASRITLEITEVRVERLQDISDIDVLAEGTPGAWVDWTEEGRGLQPNSNGPETRKFFYRKLCESINGAGSWAANPYVWAISFRRIPQP